MQLLKANLGLKRLTGYIIIISLDDRANVLKKKIRYGQSELRRASLDRFKSSPEGATHMH